MKKVIHLLIGAFLSFSAFTQSNILTYAGGTGKETFYDVMQITDGSFLVVGYADDLSWTGSAPKTELTYSATIPNGLGSNRYGFILHLSNDLQTIRHVVHFPKGAVEDIRFIKTNTLPYSPTGDLFISCNTADITANNGGYILAKLNGNFVDSTPSALSWVHVVWAKSIAKEAHPWDVTNDGRVYYISGEAYAYDWSAIYCLNQNGQRMVVNHWRTHWLTTGSEWRGTPATANPLGGGGIGALSHSGIVLKSNGRCDLRSWTANEYHAFYPDGNGGSKKGKWPLDILFNGPCDPMNPTAVSPGYTGYAQSSTPVYGGSSITVDRRNNDLFIGMNFKSVLPVSGFPDFEPAVIAMDSTGSLKWWSRLYHEITADGDTVNSTPDQYVDALAIDYSSDKLVVGARCHGNNVENFWKGNLIHANPSAFGFQNQFTGTQGNIHISWLGKFQLENGVLVHSTYMAEYAEGTGGLGAPLTDPNLAGWPNPNAGWPNLNTTRMAKNQLKLSTNGDVCVLAVGRRTITTSNAHQKMVLPTNGGLSAWNSFVRVYDAQLNAPKYSSLIVGVWDTLTQAGGGNTEMFGVYKTAQGVICVGRQNSDSNGVATGNNIPISNVTPWGNTMPQGESAILAYYKATNLSNANDSVSNIISTLQDGQTFAFTDISIFPNPANKTINIGVYHLDQLFNYRYRIIDAYSRILKDECFTKPSIDVQELTNGLYLLQLYSRNQIIEKKFLVIK